MSKPVNINIIDGESFFAHELTANFTPTQFSLDFKNITPRSDPRNQHGPSFTLKHNVIMIEPWHAKALVEVLSNVVGRYEKEYGTIKKPVAMVKAEKKQKKTKTKETIPSYFG